MNNTLAISHENNTITEVVEQHSLRRTIFLHLLPGVIITLLFWISGPIAKSLGFPPQAALLLSALVVLIPTLGHLLYQGKKRNGKLSLTGIVLYREPMPWWQYIVFVVLVNVYAVIVLVLIGPLQPIITNFFSWWPVFSLRLDTGHYPALNYLIAAIVYILVNGFVAPVIEEIYFRGYLLPRLSRLGFWAPALNLILFLCYHFWQPWNIPVYMVALWPFSFLTWKKKNVYIAMAIHCSLNVVGMLPLILTLLKH